MSLSARVNLGESSTIQFQFSPADIRVDLDQILYNTNIAAEIYLLYLLAMADAELKRLAEDVGDRAITIPVDGDYEFSDATFNSPVSVEVGSQINRALMDKDIDRVIGLLADFMVKSDLKISLTSLQRLTSISS